MTNHSTPKLIKNLINQQVLGTWKLVSFELRNEVGEINYPYGQDAIGILIYTADGYMSVTIMSKNRSCFTSGDLIKGNSDEKCAAIDTYLSYCGRYEVHADRIIHYPETSLFPNWVSVPQERLLHLVGNQLTLSTSPTWIGGQRQVACLTWRRSHPMS